MKLDKPTTFKEIFSELKKFSKKKIKKIKKACKKISKRELMFGCIFLLIFSSVVAFFMDRHPYMISANITDQTIGVPKFKDEGYSFVMIPDTQNYTKNKKFTQNFEKMMQWIVDEKDDYNIKLALHVGDITNNNNHEQWVRAKRALKVLDGQVPYVLATGNHDTGENGKAEERSTHINEYFHPSDNSLNDPESGGIYVGSAPGSGLENAYYTLNIKDDRYLVLSLEWGPRNKVIRWANEIAHEHPEHRKILVTHAYLYDDDTRYDWREKGKDQSNNVYKYGTASDPEGTNDGEEIWNKLVSKHPNWLFTFSGHVHKEDGVGYLGSIGHDQDGHVHQILFDTQDEEEGGGGWLRLIEFLPDGNTIQVRTYSPTQDVWRTDHLNQYTLQIR